MRLTMQLDNEFKEFWTGEDALQFNGVPEALWSDAPKDRPPDPPEPCFSLENWFCGVMFSCSNARELQREFQCAWRCEGTKLIFLERRLVRLQDGFMVVPGTTVEKVLSAFE